MSKTKLRKRPRGSEPRTRRRSVNVTPTLDRAIERHAERIDVPALAAGEEHRETEHEREKRPAHGGHPTNL